MGRRVLGVMLVALAASGSRAVAQESTETEQVAAVVQPSDTTKEVTDTVQEKKPDFFIGHGSKGFEIGTTDGDWLMQLQLRLQFRFAYPKDQDPITNDDFLEPDQYLFKVNRSRIKWGGNAYRPWLKYYMEYDVGASVLLDFRFMIEKYQALNLKVGQWKAQYSLERIISSGKQEMMERSIVNRAFTIDRQQGVSLYGRLRGSGSLDFSYWASVFTGMGRGARFNDDENLMWMFRGQWNIFGRVVPFTGSDVDYTEKPTADIAFAAVTNQSPYTRFSTSGGGELVGFEPGEPGQYRVNQWYQETALKYRGFAWQQEFHWKKVKDTINLTDRTLTGWYFQAGYFFHYLLPTIPKPLEFAAQAAYYNPVVGVSGDLLQEYSFAANWFFNGQLNKLSADITYFRFDFPELETQDEWRVRLQWEIST